MEPSEKDGYTSRFPGATSRPEVLVGMPAREGRVGIRPRDEDGARRNERTTRRERKTDGERERIIHRTEMTQCSTECNERERPGRRAMDRERRRESERASCDGSRERERERETDEHSCGRENRRVSFLAAVGRTGTGAISTVARIKEDGTAVSVCTGGWRREENSVEGQTE